MRRLLPSITGALALAAVAATSSSAEAAMAHLDQPVDRIYIRYVQLSPGQSVTYETVNLSAGADPVLHLWGFDLGEVAFDDDSGTEPGAARLTYTNNTATSRVYYLFIRAADASGHGTASLELGGVNVANITIGGLRLDVDNAPGWQHESVAAPGGPQHLSTIGLDSGGHMVDYDIYGGVGYGTRIEHPDIDEIVVGSLSGSTAPVNVYSNDTVDLDGDGLGTLLEQELGTCDSDAWAHCTDVHNLADTDRDGLPDAAEVFGIEAGYGSQYLPMWGADPLHKDVFVEVDYTDEFTSNEVEEADALWSQQLFLEGQADDLQNPDGSPGVHLHLDIDKPCPNYPDLCGDWGGSNSVPAGTNYKTAPDDHRAAVRAGVFRYALMYNAGGGGQSKSIPSDRFKWGGQAHNRYMGAFTHELGHAIGLEHYGHPDWGSANGKPNYRSLMNYAWKEWNFSQGEADAVLNPSFVEEVAGIGTDASYLEISPWNKLVGPNEEIDWDFDSLFSDESWGAVKAPVTYATTSGTGAFSGNSQFIHTEDDLPGFTPALVLGPNDRMYAFYVDDGGLHYRFAHTTGDTFSGSCPGGDEIGDECMSWSDAHQVPLLAPVTGISVVYEDGVMLIVYRGSDDLLRGRRMLTTAAGTLTPSGGDFSLHAHTDEDPEVEVMRVDPAQFGGDDRVIGIFYRNSTDGHYRWRSMSHAWTSSSTYRGELRDETGAVLEGTQGPSFASWPYDPFSVPDGTSCGALTNTAGRVGIHCYDRTTNRFETMTAFSGLGPFSDGKPGLAYHAYRSFLGVPRLGDETRGAFWLTVTADDPDYDVVRVWISDPVSENPVEMLQDLVFPGDRDGLWSSVWTNLVDGSGLALLDHPDLGSMKALGIYDQGSDGAAENRLVNFMPFADGSFNAEMRDGNDFRVMERGICRGLQSSNYCGLSTWGLN